MTKNLKKFTAEKKFIFFWSKTALYLSLGLHTGRPSYKRSLHFKTWNFKIFSTFVGHFCPPGSEYGSGSNRDPDPDPQPCLKVKSWTMLIVIWRFRKGWIRIKFFRTPCNSYRKSTGTTSNLVFVAQTPDWLITRCEASIKRWENF